ncbi:hypothetical protein [Methylobacterium nodulans]|uniref:Uncharacterized protein n=1 Tax=Methylobacterium nodulans (strain LMG 21967 / CNCM I-2342 / ORS 2060) TaxID=460265 RepID=B8IHP3_METNO|nr:hypothetical protein [Methylobacterium nodulans]ACL61706.1 hypothetical protein Mnod_6964 [Methylobacterium nodulans ORS 2060]
MRPGALTEGEADAIYTALVEEAGAPDDVYDREMFVRSAAGVLPLEWRFQGRLGFGGKLYFDGERPPRVDCYPQDRNEEREAIIARTNERLTILEILRA